MSLDVLTAVWNHSPAKGTELLVHLALADWADQRGRCDPSYTQLAKKARISRRYALDIVDRLATAGLLTIEKGAGFSFGKSGSSNRITLVIPTAPGEPGFTTPSELGITGGGELGITTQRSTTTVNTTVNSKDIARDDAAPETSPPSESKRKPVKAKAPPAPRAPKPMYDAFKAAFPTAQPWEAQTFDTAATAEGLTVERWHAFMALPESRQDYPRYLTRKNATDRFIGWSRATRRDPTREAGDNGASLAARNEAFLKAKGWA